MKTENYKLKINSGGFTIPELLIVVGMLTTLLGLTTINLLTSRDKVTISTTIDTLISDIKLGQTKAMSGDTEGSGTISDYGMYFETNRYTVFRGSTYASGNPSNFITNLDPNFELSSILFPSSTLIFSKGSGEVSGFVSGFNSITIRNKLTGEQKVITVNRYGVITGIN